MKRQAGGVGVREMFLIGHENRISGRQRCFTRVEQALFAGKVRAYQSASKRLLCDAIPVVTLQDYSPIEFPPSLR